jgi:hypothetical protein
LVRPDGQREGLAAVAVTAVVVLRAAAHADVQIIVSRVTGVGDHHDRRVSRRRRVS